MNINGYDIKPGANLNGADLRGANLRDANLRDANLPDDYLEKQEEKETTPLSQRVKELEEELAKYKEYCNQMKAILGKIGN